MYIEINITNGRKYLKLGKSLRVKNEAGYSVAKKTTVLNIGALSYFDDGKPDYLKRLRESFLNGNPLIPALLPYCPMQKPKQSYEFTVEEGGLACLGHPKIYSHQFLDRIIDELGIKRLFYLNKSMRKIEYDVYGFFKLLVFGRILHPASKISTVEQNNDYYDPIISDYDPFNVYDTLDFIADNKDKLIRKINSSLVEIAGRSTEIVYYYVTNVCFEIEETGEDIIDEDGAIIRHGLRKYGVSKEHRMQQIVQMGLFMDDKGVPITIEEFPCSTLEHFALFSAFNKSINNLNYSRFIMIGDRGMCVNANLLQLLDSGNGYIISKSVLESTLSERAWMYSEEDYIYDLDNFKYKSRIVTRTVRNSYNESRIVTEKTVVCWSDHLAKRSMAENKSFLEFVSKLTDSPSNFKITSLQAESLCRFLKEELISIKTGDVFDSSEIKQIVDTEKVKEFKKSMGYYQIITSELEMDPNEIIDKYLGATRIEEQFRVMKSCLASRPVFAHNPNHTKGHLLICLISLIIMQIIQSKIAKTELALHSKEEMHKPLNWTSGLSAERIQNALNKWQVETLVDDYFRFNNIDNTDLKLILEAFKIEIAPRLYRRGELKAIKTATEIFS